MFEAVAIARLSLAVSFRAEQAGNSADIDDFAGWRSPGGPLTKNKFPGIVGGFHDCVSRLVSIAVDSTQGD
jgi:hypothetical protein